MNCNEYKDKLFAYVEGLLDDSDKEAIAAHLKVCSVCRDEVSKTERLRERLVADGATYAESDLENAVFDRIVREQTFKLRKVETANYKIGIWRNIMNTKVTKFAAAAVIIIGVVMGYLMFRDTSSVSWADVVEQIRMVKTMSYEWTLTGVMNPGSESEQIGESQRGRFYSQDPGKCRWESLDENGEIRQIIISLFSGNKRSTMVYNLTREGKWDINTTSGIAVNKDELYRTEHLWKTLEKVTSEQAMEIGEKVIDGVAVVGFMATSKKLGLLTPFNGTLEVWVDQDTAVPIQIEAEYQDDGQKDVFMRHVMKNIQWNTPLDEKLFQLPEGVEISERESRPLFFTRTQLKDNVTVWVGPRGGSPVVTEKDIAKVSCGTTSIEREGGNERYRTIIYFDLNEDGEEKLRSHTKTHINEKLLIDFNGEIIYERTIKTEVGPRFIVVLCESEIFEEHELSLKEFEENYLKE